MDENSYILLIDGDNINYTYLDPFVKYVESKLGNICQIHLFGKLGSSYLDDWKHMSKGYTEKTIFYDVSDSCKNDTDIQMIHFAWKCVYRDGLHKFIIMSSDSDMKAVVSDLCTEAEVVIGYNHHKVSAKYLQYLKEHKVTAIDLDEVRGPLSGRDVITIINCVTQSYLEYKLGEQYFSFDTILDWLHERYPDIGNIDKDVLLRALAEYKVAFTKDGVSISRLE